MTTPNPYESGRMAHEYLLFHYGTADQVLPWAGGPREALEFPARCAALVVAHSAPRQRSRALDLGCAVGRSTFELAGSFDQVVGIDFSHSFVEIANALRAAGCLQAARREEGDLSSPVLVQVPPNLPRTKSVFEQGDAGTLRPDLGDFDAVLLANLICRMPDATPLLSRLPSLVRPGGLAVFTTPCTWLEEFTPREKWMGGLVRDGKPLSTLDGLRAALAPAFVLEHTEDLPFLLREHARKYQWSVAQGSVWRRMA